MIDFLFLLPTATSAPSEEPVLDDIYFKQKPIDNKEEHDLYEAARHRLQDKQDARLSRVMQQWQEAQRQYEELKKKDPQGANVMQEAMLTVSTCIIFKAMRLQNVSKIVLIHF